MHNSLRALFAFSTIGLSTVCASELTPLHVTVPFAFTAGKTSLPAGDYTITEQDSKVIMIQGTRGSAILLGTSSGETQTAAGMSFHHTEAGYVLSEVRAWGKPASIVLPAVETPAK